MNGVSENGSHSITKPASKVMVGGIFSLLGGLAANVVVAAIFGAGASMDAYLTALVVPSYFQIVFFNSLYFVFIPAFIDSESQQGDEDAWALVGTFFWIALGLLVGVSVIGSLLSTQIIALIAPGFEPEKAALAAQMLSVLFYATPFIGISTLTVGIQNARSRFFWPSAAPAFGSLANVLVLLLLSSTLGPMSLCWGYIASTVLQGGFTILPVVSHGWKHLLPLTDPRVRQIGKLMAPLVLFGFVISLSPIAERYFASGLPNGQIAYMGYANKVSSIFVLLFASGIAAAIFPSMARAYAQEGVGGLAEKCAFGLRLTFAVALPAISILGALAYPLVSVFFERGAFLPTDTIGVSRIVFAYILGDILFRMVGNIFQRSLYVLKDTLSQPLVNSSFVLLFIGCARFIVARWGYVGLVWASATRSGLGVLFLWLILSRKLPRQKTIGYIFPFVVKYLVAAAAAFLSGWCALQILGGMPAIIQLIAGGMLSLFVYGLLLYFLDRDMLFSVLEMTGLVYIFASVKDFLRRLPSRGQKGGIDADRTHFKV